jgi:hypothetical protein
MNRTLTRFGLAAPLVLLSSLSTVSAQSKAPAAEAAVRAEADRAGKEGERLLAQHDVAAAVNELGKAYNLSHNPRFLLPLGLAYAEAERPLDALDALGRYLKDSPSVPDAKRKEIGAKFAVMLDQASAVVTVEASRQNAPIKVDGRPIGTTPIDTPLRLLPGKHEIVMQPAATDPSSGARVVVDIKPGERRAVKLEPGARSRFLEPQSLNQEASPQTDEPARRSAGEQPALAATTPTAPPPASGETGSRLTSKWWFWTLLGGGAVAVTALGVGLGVGLGSHSSSPTGAAGDQFPNVATWKGGPIDVRPSALVSVAGFRL